VRRVALLAATTVALAACSGAAFGAAGDESVAPETGSLPASVPAIASVSLPPDDQCDAATPIERGPFGMEIVGLGTDATLYGLLFLRRPPPIATGDEVKIVWRMTGEGAALTVDLIDPSGEQQPLPWGPEPHGGSTYNRPGAEWGTGFVFDQSGCWHLHFERDVGAADVWIDVFEAAPSTSVDTTHPAA
jgi:hypothetical protein